MNRMVLLVLLLAIGLELAVGAKGGGKKRMRADVQVIKEQNAEIMKLLKKIDTCVACQANTTEEDGFADRVLVQQHYGHSSFFNRSWAEFKAGFGDVRGNYWIGNDRLHELTKDGTYRLRVDVKARLNGQWYWAEYGTFIVGAESTKYTLQIGGYSGNAGDSLTLSAESNAIQNAHSPNGMQFSTFDRDNDNFGSQNCANWPSGCCSGGFWYNGCGGTFINSAENTHWGSAWLKLPIDPSKKDNVVISRMSLV